MTDVPNLVEDYKEGATWEVVEDEAITAVGALQLTQAGADEVVPGSDRRILPRITYFKCHELGHFADFFSDSIKQYHINAKKVNKDVTWGIADTEPATTGATKLTDNRTDNKA